MWEVNFSIVGHFIQTRFLCFLIRILPDLISEIESYNSELCILNSKFYTATFSQINQFEEIKTQTKAQIQNILTPEQQEQFQALTSEAQQRLEAVKQLNLSREQNTQVREIVQSSR